MNIVLIGSGNVATHLGMLIKRRGHKILQVYSKTAVNASKLAAKLRCSYTIDPNGIYQDADVYIISLRDEFVKSFLKKIHFKPKLIVHTSGSLDINVFPSHMNNTGVLYPVQTFSKQNKHVSSEIPFCIEAGNARSFRTIKKFAESLSPVTLKINSSDRTYVHMAAVFSNNFTNYLYIISEKILEKRKISFDILRPLIEETVKKIMHNSPSEMQTGPARRGDKSVIRKHLQLLDKDSRNIYRLLTQHIEKDFHK